MLGDTPPFFFDQTIKKKDNSVAFFVCDLYKAAEFLVERFWDVAK